jgi:hypothetical protein
MGLLDDAIREHLELKRRSGAAAEEVTRLEHEAFGSDAAKAAPASPDAAHAVDPVDPEPVADVEPIAPVAPEPVAAEVAPEPAGLAPEPTVAVPEAVVPEPEPEPAQPPAPVAFTDDEPWLDEPDEVPAEEALDHRREPASDYVAPDDEPESEDVLEETPEFLSETPEHDRLWFEQKPPRDFDFGG